jgi:hypothetical protein
MIVEFLVPLILGLVVVAAVVLVWASSAFVFAWAGRRRWRFTLRTLLIATTLVAVVLGLIVWLSR